MTQLKKPAECGEIAEKHIGEYVRECGAYGDPEAIRKVLEMLISTCALGIVTVADDDVAQKVLLRTCLTAAEYAERQKRKAS